MFLQLLSQYLLVHSYAFGPYLGSKIGFNWDQIKRVMDMINGANNINSFCYWILNIQEQGETITII